MLNFVTALPGELDPRALYFVGDGTPGSKAEFYISNANGEPIPVATSAVIQALAAAEAESAVQALVGSAPAALNTLEELADAFDNNPDIIENLVTQVAEKANASEVYTKEEIDSKEQSLQGSIDGKQDALLNAQELEKYQDGAYDGKAIVVVGAAEW